MLKHPACAAAINSSGFVPGEFSNRVVNEYGVLFNTPLAVETVPLPCLRSPCQTADAVLFITRPLSYHPPHSAIRICHPVGNAESSSHNRVRINMDCAGRAKRRRRFGQLPQARTL